MPVLNHCSRTSSHRVFRVVAEDERLPGVALGVPVDRSEVKEEDVLLAEDHAGVGVGVEVLGGIRAEPDDHPVPALPHAQFAEHLPRHGDGVLLDHPRGDLRGDREDRLMQALADVKQLLGLVVRTGCLVVNLGGHRKPLISCAGCCWRRAWDEARSMVT
jgi:hypothetical protein